MALFSDDDVVSLKDDVPKGLAEIGGFGAGFGAGQLLRYPIDSSYQKKLVQEALELNKAKEQSRENWETMLKLYTGKMSLEELPPERREFYQKLLKEEAEELKYLSRNPYAAHQSLNKFDQGKLVPLFDDVKMTRNFPEKVHSPVGKTLPGLLGLAGFYTAGQTYKHLNDKGSPKP
ncbi:hypothetical protein [Priestia megaterium]|uniref:hypothetical protein n=1 Tax=Priestia megaterium TaxID=1404 RepID=UPI000BFC3060|nr:hypothetical protein [Priestia megaterium]PGQ88205.1 hypothetical protein COA18_04575 [Priestia megaterium]